MSDLISENKNILKDYKPYVTPKKSSVITAFTTESVKCDPYTLVDILKSIKDRGEEPFTENEIFNVIEYTVRLPYPIAVNFITELTLISSWSNDKLVQKEFYDNDRLFSYLETEKQKLKGESKNENK